MFQNRVILKIKGKNIERFLKRIINKEIELLDIKYLNYKEVLIEIKKSDLKKINDIKTIYEIEIVKLKGIIKIIENLKINRFVIISFIISLILFYLLCNTIFSVEVIHNNEELRNIIKTELENYNIKKYEYKKDYKYIKQVKEKILKKYKDKIEWLEIIDNGVKYIVRVEERIINKEDKNYYIRNIIAKKDAIIVDIDAKKGEIVKNKNDYVKKGDVVITGSIYLNDNFKKNIMADGSIYGEVWYKTTIEYPLYYKEEIYTGRVKKVLSINFLNFRLPLFDFKKYKNKDIKKNLIFKNNIIPFSINYDLEKEIKIKELNLTYDEAIKLAIEKAKDKIKLKLREKEYIIDVKKLKVEKKYSKIIVELFISVCEDITDYEEIIEE